VSAQQVNRAYLIGVFDLFHIGHLKLLKRASECCDKLVVGIVDDQAVKQYKGEDRPIQEYDDRAEFVKELGLASEIVKMKDFAVDPEDGFGNIDLFIRGEDQSHIDISYVTEKGIPIVTLPRTPSVSTSKLVGKLNKAKGEVENDHSIK